METLIKSAFLHSGQFSSRVEQGQYDLIGPDGNVILPEIWDMTVRPDITIEMIMRNETRMGQFNASNQGPLNRQHMQGPGHSQNMPNLKQSPHPQQQGPNAGPNGPQGGQSFQAFAGSSQPNPFQFHTGSNVQYSRPSPPFNMNTPDRVRNDLPPRPPRPGVLPSAQSKPSRSRNQQHSISSDSFDSDSDEVPSWARQSPDLKRRGRSSNTKTYSRSGNRRRSGSRPSADEWTRSRTERINSWVPDRQARYKQHENTRHRSVSPVRSYRPLARKESQFSKIMNILRKKSSEGAMSRVPERERQPY